MPTIPSSNSVTMTVNLDKTASLNNMYLGNRGEVITLTVVVPVGISGSGYDAYLDFIQPDGSAYFKGPYDCSSGTFNVVIGSVDTIMDNDGKISWQFVLASTVALNRTIVWTSNQYKSKIQESIGAVLPTFIPYVPSVIMLDGSNISYNGPATGNNVTDAINNIHNDSTNLSFTGSTHDALVTGALIDSEGEDFGVNGNATYLNGRLNKWELTTSDIAINLKHPGHGLTGAIFDGITDDAPTIQTIIDYFKINETTEDIPTNTTICLFAPAGKCLLNSTITLPGYMALKGAGRHLTIFTGNITDGSAIIKIEVSGLAPAYNQLEGFTIDGQVKNCIGIEMIGCIRWVLRDINVMFCMSYGIRLYGSYLGEMYSIFVKYCGSVTNAGIILDGTESNFGCHAVKMYGGEIASCLGDGFHIKYGVNSGLYGTTTEGNVGSGIKTTSPISFTVTGCYFEINKNHILHLGGSSTYSNNFFGVLRAASTAHIVINNIYDSLIEGNKHPDADDFIGATTEAGALYCQGTQIINNGRTAVIDASILAFVSVGNIFSYFDGISATIVYGKQKFVNAAVFDSAISALEIYGIHGAGAGIDAGAGTPESSVDGVIGKVFHRTDGAMDQNHYIKAFTSISGDTNRGWLPVQLVYACTTVTRPTITRIGFSLFDTSLGIPIWWNGTVWKDAAGATV